MKSLLALLFSVLFFLPAAKGQKKRAASKVFFLSFMPLKQLPKKNLIKEEGLQLNIALGPPFPTDYSPLKNTYDLNRLNFFRYLNSEKQKP